MKKQTAAQIEKDAKKHAKKAPKVIAKAIAKVKAEATKAEATKTKAAKPAPETESKKATIMRLLNEKAGATIAELIAATGWQAHSIRGFVSGHLRKALNLTVTTTPNAQGENAYRLA